MIVFPSTGASVICIERKSLEAISSVVSARSMVVLLLLWCWLCRCAV